MRGHVRAWRPRGGAGAVRPPRRGARRTSSASSRAHEARRGDGGGRRRRPPAVRARRRRPPSCRARTSASATPPTASASPTPSSVRPPLVKAANWLTTSSTTGRASLWRHWLLALSRRFRLLRYDERGCGLSDWNTTAFTLEAWVEDLATVVDAAGYERFPLLGVSQGAAVAVEYAAAPPRAGQRARCFTAATCTARSTRARTDDERRLAELLPDLAELGWGSDEPSFRQVFTARFMPGGTQEQWDEFNELQRRSTSPTNAARFLRGFGTIDVTEAAQRCARARRSSSTSAATSTPPLRGGATARLADPGQPVRVAGR